MKKKIIALALLLCLSMTACSPAGAIRKLFLLDLMFGEREQEQQVEEDEDYYEGAVDDYYEEEVEEEEVQPDYGEEYFDYSALGITPYEYGSEFSMGSNLQAGLEQTLYNVYDGNYWKNTDVESDSYWTTSFVDHFLQNSWFGIDYYTDIYNNQGSVISDEQIEYVQYSLTGVYVPFNDSVDMSQAASGVGYVVVTGYDVNRYGDGYNNQAALDLNDRDTGDVELTVYYTGNYQTAEGNMAEENYRAYVVLKKNPYSCFDGYSIVSIENL